MAWVGDVYVRVVCRCVVDWMQRGVGGLRGGDMLLGGERDEEAGW